MSRAGQLQKIKDMIKIYGSVGIATHTVLSLTSLGVTYSLVRYGNLDYQKVFDKLGINQNSIKDEQGQQGNNAVKNASDFTIAYIIHKSTMPVRVPITLAVVPIVARAVKRGKK